MLVSDLIISIIAIIIITVALFLNEEKIGQWAEEQRRTKRVNYR